MVGVLLAKPLAARFGKRRTFPACLLLSALFMAAFVPVPPDGLWSLFALPMLLSLIPAALLLAGSVATWFYPAESTPLA